MTNEEFEAHVKDHSDTYVDLNYAVIALNGEAGEVAEWYKKKVLRGNKLGLTDRDLMEELGDVLWYLTAICNLKDWTLSEVMAQNKLKLDDRRLKKFKQVV